MAANIFNARLAAQTDLIEKPEFDFKLKDISDRLYVLVMSRTRFRVNPHSIVS